MKIQLLRDVKGEIMATYQKIPGAMVSAEVEVEKDTELVELEVPDEYADLSSNDFFKKVQSGISTKQFKVIKK